MFTCSGGEPDDPSGEAVRGPEVLTTEGGVAYEGGAGREEMNEDVTAAR